MLTTSKLVWQKSLRGMAGFTSAEFRVLMMMSTYTDAKGCGAHPGMDRLASDSCVDRRTAQRAAASLIKKGWLICKRKGGNEVGWRVADEYELADPAAIHKGGMTPPLVKSGRAALKTEGRRDTALKGGIEDTGRAVSDRPIRSLHQIQASSDHHPSSDGSRRGRSAGQTGSLREVSADESDHLEVVEDFAINLQPPRGLGWDDLKEDFELLENVPKLRDGFAAIVAAFQNAWAVLSPIFSQVATAIGAAFGDSEGGAASTFSKLVGIVGTAMSLIGAQIQMWLSVISALWSAFGPTILTVVTTVFTAVQGVISGVMTFVQGIISAVLAAIQGDWSGAWEGIRTAVSGAWQAISAIVSLGIAQARAYMSAGWAAIKAVVSAAWAAITSAISAGVNSAISFVASLPGRALAALGNIGGILTGAGRSLIQGFINGITSMISTVQSTLSGLTSKLTSWKGPPSKDATLLAGAGRLVIGGFITGMESQYGAVQRSLAGLTGTVASTQLDPLAIAGSPAGDGRDGSSLSRQDLAYLAAAVVQGLTGATLVLDGVDHMANSVAARINATYSRTVAMNSPGGR